MLTPNHVFASQVTQANQAVTGDHIFGQLVCPNKPGATDLILDNYRNLFDDFARRDLSLHTFCACPYDYGGSACDQCRPWIVTFGKLYRQVWRLGLQRHIFQFDCPGFVPDWHESFVIARQRAGTQRWRASHLIPTQDLLQTGYTDSVLERHAYILPADCHKAARAGLPGRKVVGCARLPRAPTRWRQGMCDIIEVQAPGSGSLCLDGHVGCMCLNGDELRLTPTQHAILFAILCEPRQRLGQTEVDALLPGSNTSENRRQHICQLRRRLAPVVGLRLVADRGRGYRVEDASGGRLQVRRRQRCMRDIAS